MTTGIKVYKFGGSSLADAKNIRQVASIVQQQPHKTVVVLSAMGGMTDLLLGAARGSATGADASEATKQFRQRHIDAAHELLREGSDRTEVLSAIEAAADEFESICVSLSTLGEHTQRILDRTASRGEQLMARLFSAYMNQEGVPARYFDATQLIKAVPHEGSLSPDLDASAAMMQKELASFIKADGLAIVPGFIAAGPDDMLVTLGRGGTDLSAAVIAHGLNADSVTLYKEVDGLMTADPRSVPSARVIQELHYREAAELAYYGAKILHSRTIIPLITAGIPLHIRNTFNPELPGTRIGGDVTPGAFPVKALTAVRGQALLAVEGKGMMGVPGIAGRTFTALANSGVSVSVISQASSESSICFVVPSELAETGAAALRQEFRWEIEHEHIDDIRIAGEQAVLAVVGLGMKGTPGISARVFGALGRAGVNIEAIAQGSSELNISVVTHDSDVDDALAALHREFRLEKLKALAARKASDVEYMVYGLGQIGRTLIDQIQDQRSYYREKMDLNLRAIGVADRSGMLWRDDSFSDELLAAITQAKSRGISLVQQAREPGPVPVDQLWEHASNKGVFVDTTATDSGDLVSRALKAGWHVALANKKPLADEQELFDSLFELAAQQGLQLRYEATVGAGLPILDTLAKLRSAGDEILSITGCLSGTLGYLMASIESGVSFSEAVKRAHAQGFTEPDPREDLCGMDVGRKALILARTLGRKIDHRSLAVEPLYPDNLDNDDPQAFMNSLTALDEAWQERIKAAKANKQVIRYTAQVLENEVKVGLEELPVESPFGGLKGTDNQVVIRTRRYDENPLIVTGPGAGAAVTAAGVLNDMIAIATMTDGDHR